MVKNGFQPADIIFNRIGKAVLGQSSSKTHRDKHCHEDCKQAVKDIDYVFMCAANTSGAKVMATTPLAHLTPNLLMNMNMLEASYEAGVDKFLFLSSNTVYPLTDFAVKEGDVTNEFYKSYHIVAWMKRFTEIVSTCIQPKYKSQ